MYPNNTSIQKIMSTIQSWKVWTTIRLGIPCRSGTTGENFYYSVHRSGYFAPDESCKRILYSPEFRLETKERQVELIETGLVELGFGEDGASHEELCNRAIECGLKLCPIEVGPQVCIQQLGVVTSRYSGVSIGMKPVVTGRKMSEIFSIMPPPELGKVHLLTAHTVHSWCRGKGDGKSGFIFMRELE